MFRTVLSVSLFLPLLLGLFACCPERSDSQGAEGGWFLLDGGSGWVECDGDDLPKVVSICSLKNAGTGDAALEVTLLAACTFLSNLGKTDEVAVYLSTALSPKGQGYITAQLIITKDSSINPSKVLGHFFPSR